MVWSGLIRLRIGTSGGLLWTRWWTFGFHKMLGSSWVAAQLAASQDGLSSMKLVAAAVAAAAVVVDNGNSSRRYKNLHPQIKFNCNTFYGQTRARNKPDIIREVPDKPYHRYICSTYTVTIKSHKVCKRINNVTETRQGVTLCLSYNQHECHTPNSIRL
jgi:hypothetical protein